MKNKSSIFLKKSFSKVVEPHSLPENSTLRIFGFRKAFRFYWNSRISRSDSIREEISVELTSCASFPPSVSDIQMCLSVSFRYDMSREFRTLYNQPLYKTQNEQSQGWQLLHTAEDDDICLSTFHIYWYDDVSVIWLTV